MVYCGKASQGCQNCRTRRIKCDKVRPECSQCQRVHKPCPGYRDQLSLMFRDESTKVIQKAHASWGIDSNEASTSLSPVSPAASPLGGFQEPQYSYKPIDSLSPPEQYSSLALPNLPLTIGTSKIDQGVQFYLKHYVVGHPDEPESADGLRKVTWLAAPGMQETMAAIGLASMSNLYEDEELHKLSRQQYGLALQHTMKSIQDLNTIDTQHAMRGVVMLALFEVVKGSHVPSEGARTHIIGAASLMRSIAPLRQSQDGGIRGLLQLCCSLFIPCQVGGLPLPDTFFDWVSLADRAVLPVDKPATDLLLIITQFVQLSAFVRNTRLFDDRPETANAIRELFDLEERLSSWGERQEGIWRYSESVVDGFPAGTIFNNKIHTYTSMWIARVWNHYRWSRLLINQMIIDFVSRYPVSSRALIKNAQLAQCLGSIRRMAEDTFVSIPTHWRHPRMEKGHRDRVENTTGAAGIGAAGVPSLLFHIKVAACSPGIPYEDFRWALGILDTVWGHTGMLQAKALADLMRAQHEPSPLSSADPSQPSIKQEFTDSAVVE